MIDIQLIRDNPDKVQQSAQSKGYEVDVREIIALDERVRGLLTQAENIRRKRNEHSSSINGKPTTDQIEQGKIIKQRLAEAESELDPLQESLAAKLGTVPNIALDDVPVGKTEEENVVMETVGEKPEFDFQVKSHAQLGEQHDWIDKERAAKIAGARYAYLKGELVELEFAVWQYGIRVLTDKKIIEQIIKENDLDLDAKPFTPVLPPAVARTETYLATGRLDSEQQTYKLDNDDLWLNASAEHTLAPMYMNEIIEEAEFPIRLVGYTTAFRREAGTYGKDSEGIIRMHQFNKLEMESFTLPENGLEEHKLMIAIQRYFMDQLKLPYRVVTKCTADIGFPNAAGTDIDVWFPGQNSYRETHTADFISDFQARRMNTRTRRENGDVDIIHTNDATAFSERPIIAILENYQQSDGSVAIPRVLQPFINKEVIGASRNT